MLFKDTNRLKEYAEFTGDINFASIKKTIRTAEETYLIPLLGIELYNSLNNAYALISDENSLQPAEKLLLDKCRMVVGPYVLYHYVPKAEIRVNDAGARRSETATEKTAYGYQVANFREQVLREAEAQTESILQFLEVNKSSYPEWVASTAFASYRSLFITSGSEFSQLVKTHTPYRNFFAMRFKMADVEEHNIRPALGNELFNALKQKTRSADAVLTERESDLLFKVKKAIAYLTVAYAIPYLNVRIDSGGVSVISTSFNLDQDARAKASDTALNHIITSAVNSGTTWLNNAVDFLNSNAADFPQWKAAAPCTGSINAELTGTFGLY